MGFAAMLVCSVIDYHTLCTYVPILYVVSALMAAATRFTPLGTDLTTGSYRWLDLGIINIQPVELCKIILILTLAVFFTKRLEHMKSFKTIFLAFVIAIIPTLFIMMQTDMSSSLVLLFVMVMMTIGSGVGWKIITPIVGVLTPLIGVFFWYIQQPGEKFLIPDYIVRRIVGFLNPETERLGVMYQQNNSMLSIASGRLYGKRLLEDTAASRNYNDVDVVESDFIWSVIGEEYGFIGSIAILALLSVIIIKCFLAAINARDYTGMMIAIGVAALFSFQTFVNVGVTTSILPNTGLPLPFLSSGLSSMLSSMMAVGIIINIRIQPARAGTSSITLMDVN
jgi:rod shape determining protein RodA